MERKRNREKEIILRNIMLKFLKKNKDYGDSAWATLEKYGIEAYKVRAYDKLLRMQTLKEQDREPEVEESIKDAAMDLFIYSGITLAWEDGDNYLDRYLDAIEYFLYNLNKQKQFVRYRVDFDEKLKPSTTDFYIDELCDIIEPQTKINDPMKLKEE